MSVLVVQLPPCPRLRAQGQPATVPVEELAFALSADGLTLQREGRAAVALLPKASTVVVVLAETDVSWHRVTCPKAPASRMRAALAGMLEDALLEELDDSHFALPAQTTVGEPAWIAVTARRWLAGELAALDKAGLHVDRVTPSVWPDEPASGHFHEAFPIEGSASPPALTWSTPDGVSTMPLQGGCARALLPQPLPQGTHFTATAAVAAPAERWLGHPVEVATRSDRLLAAARSSWNLRQFDLTPKNRGTAQLREAWRRLMSPPWRPARVGVLALLAVQLIGLNAWAWNQRMQITRKRAAMVSVLREAHPQVQAVLDAPAQMRRETELLRSAAGRTGDADLEVLMQAAASAWPEQRPVQNLRFENGGLTLAASGWNEPEMMTFRETLRPSGWQVEAADGRLTVRRNTGGGR
jgi:general secretion pathway protein L